MKTNYTYKNETITDKEDNKIVCKHCSDTGLIQIAPNVRGMKICPYCQNVAR